MHPSSPSYPLGLLKHMFKFTSVPTLLSAQRVNKQFLKAVTPWIWHTLTFHNFHGFLGLLQVTKILSKNPAYAAHVRSIKVYYSNAQVGLKSDLALDRPLALLVSLCPHLKSLTLHIHDCTKLSSSAVQAILSTSSAMHAARFQLDTLDLSFSPSILLDPIIKSISSFGFSHLKNLSISGACLGSYGLCAFNLTNLYSFTLHVDPTWGPRSLTFSGLINNVLIPNAHCLTSLHLKGIPTMDSLDVESPYTLSSLTRLTISLIGNLAVPATQDCLAYLTRKAPSLKHLCLVGAHSIDEAIPYLSNLTCLEFLHCPALNMAACSALARTCKQLRQFRVVSSPLDDLMMKTLASAGSFSDLRDFDLHAVLQVSDKGIQAIASELKRLRWIRIIDCPNISDTSILALCRAGTNCETVHLRGSQFTSNLYWLAASILRKLIWIVVQESTQEPSPPSDNAPTSSASGTRYSSGPQILDHTEWADLWGTVPKVARAVQLGCLVAAQSVATLGIKVPGAPSRGTSSTTISGSPYVPVLLTALATERAEEAALLAVSKRVQIPAPVSNRIASTSIVDTGTDVHSSDTSTSRFSPSPSTSSSIPGTSSPFISTHSILRRELYRPALRASMVMTPNDVNPYAMQDV